MAPKSTSLIRILFLIIGLIVCGGLGIFAFSEISSTGQVNKLKAFAGELGFTPEFQLAQYKACWGILSPDCGQLLFYATTLTRDGFQNRIDQVTSAKELPLTISVVNLLDINLDSDHTFTITERNSGRQAAQSESLGYRWSFKKGGKDWIISFYEVTNDGYVYALDGREIDGNIVTVELRIK